MSIQPTNFQKDAAQAVCAAFQAGRNRYLVADETGLGKTIVAREVISRMAGNKRQGAFVVYYFGSNMMLLENTINKLIKGTKWTYDSEPKKLGMMVCRPRPMDSNVHIYGFSANLIGEGSSTGDDKKERPYYVENLNKSISEGEDITPIRIEAENRSLRESPPNLIIFDEFHRYDGKVLDFLRDKWDDIKLLKMLFLSATPYNYYPSIAEKYTEAAEKNEKDGETVRLQSFEELLGMLAPDVMGPYQEYISGKQSAADFSKLLMETCIFRNERVYDEDQKYQTLPTAEDLRTHFSRCFAEEHWFHQLQSSDVRYRKLCSGLYSFPVKVYNEKNPDFYSSLLPPCAFKQMDDEFVFDQCHKLKRNGFYWDNLRFACIRHYNAEAGRDLLWVPPAMPDYKLGTRFEENPAFTKLMIFSAYKMVPRIVSGVFSAFASDDVVVEYPVTLEEIDDEMQKLWGKDLKELAAIYKNCIAPKETAEDIISELLKRLHEKAADLDDRKLELSAKYIVGSPYMCALRVCGQENQAVEISKAFNAYFAKEGIKQAICHCGITTSEGLLDYCIDGCLNAVLEEYCFSGGDADQLKNALQYGTKETGSNVCSKVHVYSSDCYHLTNSTPFTVNCHYAERFTADYSDTGKAETSQMAADHFKNCHNAFNSPFWPMILCTTSANQEGYDLDRYCCRIMHYSLPPNTMSFEQRDGRIDRRLSLLARRRMVQLYQGNSWEELFGNDIDKSGMSPYWTQASYLQECKDRGLPPLKFERIVPYFPMTSDYLLYRKLMEQKNRYRGHFGMPNESGSGIQQEDGEPLKLNKL